MIQFLGDVHGKIAQIPNCGINTIQVGDLGVGFASCKNLPDNFRFIRGNHDNPSLCRKMPEYLGDFGYAMDERLFFVSGADSVDAKYRTIGIDWWADEELSWSQWDVVVESYHGAQIVVSHDCPQFVAEQFFGITHKSLTRWGLELMYNKASPKFWVFGHHHKSMRESIGNTTFICLDKLETVQMDF